MWRLFYLYRTALSAHSGAFSKKTVTGDCVDLEPYTEGVIGFIKKCNDDVTVIKSVKLHSTNTPCLTGEICSLLRLCDTAFTAGDIKQQETTEKEKPESLKMGKTLSNHQHQRHEAHTDNRALQR